jgi:2-aminoadipate transaminase
MTNFRFSTMAGRLKRSEIRELLKLTRTPGTISFGGGLPDPAIFPYEAVEAAAIKALREKGNLALQYSPTEGEPFLKEQIVAFTERQGEKVSPDNILVMASSQQALDLLAKIFIDPGDPVVIERPSYVGTIQAFRAFGADFHAVAMDADGVIPDELERTVEALVKSGRPPKFIYVIPDFQNPSGRNLSLERRHKVLEIAARFDLPLIEDSPYRELRFRGELMPSLRSLDSDNRVVQMKTFSKIFSPGFRLGWVVGPPEVVEKLIMSKQGTDLCTSAFSSIMCAYLLKDGSVEKQIGISKELYARKAKVMLAALESNLSGIDGLTWSKPDGGMFLWLTLPGYMDALEMIRDAIEEKVAYVIGSGFYADGSGRNEMRLNFSYPTEVQIVQGIERLAKVIRARVRSRTLA